MRRMIAMMLGTTCAVAWPGTVVSASVTFTGNFQNWSNAVGPTTKLDFVFDSAQILTDQYASLGVYFPEGNDYVEHVMNAPAGSDGWVLRDTWGNLQTTFLFDKPQTAIGFTCVGGTFFELYSGDRLLYESPEFGQQPFIGAISTIPFDRIVMDRSGGGPVIDNFWFGGTVPAPGAVVILGGAFIGARRRQR